MFKIKKIVFFLFLLVLPMIGKAQEEKIAAAFNFLQTGNLDSAKIAIDQAVIHPSTSNNFIAWQVKGFVYKEIYKTKEKSNKQSPLRIMALEALKKSIELDTEKKAYADNIKGIKYFTATLYNDVISSMDAVDYEIAVVNFEKFKEYYPLYEPTKDSLKQKEIEFQIQLGIIYGEIFKQDKVKNQKFFNKANVAFDAALKIDPKSDKAYHQAGILYLNAAVDNILTIDYEVDPLIFMQVLDDNAVLFKKALPYEEKAYEINPNKKEIVFALVMIYFGLHEDEKYSFYNEKYIKMQNEK